MNWLINNDMENSRNKNRSNHRIIFAAFLMLSLLIKSALVMLIWNAVLTDLFHLSPISYLQSAGLLILCKILFGNFGFGRFGTSKRPFGKPDFREKFMQMSDQEREKLRDKWQERCRK